MREVQALMRRIWRNEKGAGLLEYAVIAAIVLGVAVGGFIWLGGRFKASMQQTGQKLDTATQQGNQFQSGW